MELKHLKTEEISGKYISLKLINTLIALITISGGIFLPFLLVNIKEELLLLHNLEKLQK